MRRLLRALKTSTKHLNILHNSFEKHYPIYAEISKKIENLSLIDELRKEIYFGGKKRGRQGYGRQMILGDLLQYIFTGRGYYFATRGDEFFEEFIRVLMYVSNLLILMEDISVDANLRNKILEDLDKELGKDFCEDNEELEKFKRLKNYEGIILGKEGKEHEDFFDSILPKRVGGVSELLVYAYLIRKNYGYVVPLLQAQRLLGNQRYIIPPDFLLLRSKGEIFGIEVGVGKERQVSSFSTITSIPVFTVTVGSFEQPQPFRCGKCRKWIIYCDKVIEACAKNEDVSAEGNPLHYINCRKCENFDNGECPFIVYYGEAYDYAGNVRKLRYHYSCVKDDVIVRKRLKRARKPKLIAPIPWVDGLEYIKPEL